MIGAGIELAERGWLPLPMVRMGIRQLLSARAAGLNGADDASVVSRLQAGPIALATDAANQQHYELPARFFETVLGPRLKYSGCYWPEGVTTLAAAEESSLEQVCERAGLQDGQSVLELGCGWGSLTLFLAARYPNSVVTAVSNSDQQRAFIEARAPTNVRVVTRDMNDFDPGSQFDRIVSIEMFEHMRNYRSLFQRTAEWLKPDGKLFVHVFCHRSHPYLFEIEGEDNWMGRYFFTGGVMPSRDLFRAFDDALVVEADFGVNGVHYARTAEAWRRAHESNRASLVPLFELVYGSEAQRWYQRWRMFFVACEELFGYRGGTEWLVGHYRFRHRGGE